jgi:hypothetical protein
MRAFSIIRLGMANADTIPTMAIEVTASTRLNPLSFFTTDVLFVLHRFILRCHIKSRTRSTPLCMLT